MLPRLRTATALAVLGLPCIALGAEPGVRPVPPRSTALAVSVEALSPLGGAGCFYRRRTLTAVLVVAGSFLGGSALLYGLHQRDYDSAVIGAFTYAGMRVAGLVGAARAEPLALPPLPPPPAPPAALPGAVVRRSIGFSYAFSF